MIFTSAITQSLLLIASIAGIAESKGVWAEFCNDDNCKVGCGRSVNIENPGCLNQNGRRSVRFHGSSTVAGFKTITLLGSPKPGCNCQQSCDYIRRSVDARKGGIIDYGVLAINGCHKLIDYDAKSFRFIGDQCKDNQC